MYIFLLLPFLFMMPFLFGRRNSREQEWRDFQKNGGGPGKSPTRKNLCEVSLRDRLFPSISPPSPRPTRPRWLSRKIRSADCDPSTLRRMVSFTPTAEELAHEHASPPASTRPATPPESRRTADTAGSHTPGGFPPARISSARNSIALQRGCSAWPRTPVYGMWKTTSSARRLVFGMQ